MGCERIVGFVFLRPGVVIYEHTSTDNPLCCPGWRVNGANSKGLPCMPMMVDPGAWISSIVTPI